jgi:hypothetical protein
MNAKAGHKVPLKCLCLIREMVVSHHSEMTHQDTNGESPAYHSRTMTSKELHKLWPGECEIKESH